MVIRLISTTVLLASSISFAQIETPAHSRPMIINVPSGSQSYLGVGLAEIDSGRARQLKLKEEYGVELTHIEEDSPAAKAGLKAGDVILEYNGQRVEGMEEFARFVHETPAGREVKLTIFRDGKRQTIPVKIGMHKTNDANKWTMNMPPNPPAPPAPPEMGRAFMMAQSPHMGIEVEPVDGQIAQFFGVKEGVLVRSVVKGSAADQAGLRAGDVITRIDDSAVTSPFEVARAVRSATRTKKTFPVTLTRDKREMTVNVTVQLNDDHTQGRLFFFNDDGGHGLGLESLDSLFVR